MGTRNKVFEQSGCRLGGRMWGKSGGRGTEERAVLGKECAPYHMMVQIRVEALVAMMDAERLHWHFLELAYCSIDKRVVGWVCRCVFPDKAPCFTN